MNEKKRAENKKEDKKFLRKFLMILAVSFLVGLVGGFVIAFLEDATELPQMIANGILGIIVPIAPYVSLIFAVVMTAVLLFAYKKAKTMAKAWDGENEEEYERIDNMLGNVLTASNIGTCIVYFFFAVGFETIPENALITDIIYIGGFILALAIVIVGQQLIINLTKILNPEKKGSVFDSKFLDKWEGSCDEAEKILIYKSAFKTYTTMNTIFVTLWLFCIFGNSIWKFGLMPVTMVSVVWILQVCLYTYYSKYFSKHPEKIGVFK